MSIASRIIEATGPNSSIGIPCVQGNYEGSENTYLSFKIDTYPNNFADDYPLTDKIIVMMHLFAPFLRNTRVLREQIREAIADAGFTYPTATDVSENTRASDGTEQHIVFEFEDAIGVGSDAG